MGWDSGSTIANDIWGSIRRIIKPEYRRCIAHAIIKALEAHDWDTQCDSPLLMADAGRPVSEAADLHVCSRFGCLRPAGWRGNVSVNVVLACNEHVTDISNPEML